MNKDIPLVLLILLGSGFILTVFSTIYTQPVVIPPDVYGVHSQSLHGFPFLWLRKSIIVYPGNPTLLSVNSLPALVLDIIIWSLAAGIPIVIVFRRFQARKRN